MFRLILAVALLFLVFYFIDLSELVSVLANLDYIYVIYLFGIAFLVVWLSCLKWHLFVKASGHNPSLWTLMKYYTIGYFFNIFTPSYVGGDLSRSLQLGKDLNSNRDAFISTFLERFTGLLAMSFLGFIFVVYGTEFTSGIEVAIYLIFVLTCILATICFVEPISRFSFSFARTLLSKLPGRKFHSKIEGLLLKVEQGMEFARNDLVLFFKAMLLSFAFHVITVLNTWVAAKSIGWDPSFAGLFVVVPLILLVSMIPLTPNGIGLQEGAFLFFLRRVGGTDEQGLSVGLVLRAKVMIVALFGGLLWMMAKKRIQQKDA